MLADLYTRRGLRLALLSCLLPSAAAARGGGRGRGGRGGGDSGSILLFFWLATGGAGIYGVKKAFDAWGERKSRAAVRKSPMYQAAAEQQGCEITSQVLRGSLLTLSLRHIGTDTWVTCRLPCPETAEAAAHMWEEIVKAIARHRPPRQRRERFMRE